MRLIYVACPDHEFDALYRDGILVYDSDPDHLRYEPIAQLVEYRVLEAELQLKYLSGEDYNLIIDGNGYPKEIIEILPFLHDTYN